MTTRIKNGTEYVYRFYLVNADDDETPEESKSPTVYLMKSDETAFTITSGTATECEEGWYSITLTTSETDTDGDLVIYATGTGTDRWVDKVQVYTENTGPFTITITETQYENIADQVLRRNSSAARASSAGDTLSSKSLLGMIAKHTNRTKNNTISGELEVYQEDDTTLWYGDPVTTVSYDSAAVITEVNPSA